MGSQPVITTMCTQADRAGHTAAAELGGAAGLLKLLHIPLRHVLHFTSQQIAHHCHNVLMRSVAFVTCVRGSLYPALIDAALPSLSLAGFVPYSGEGFAMLLPSKWNPSKEKDFPGVVLR